MNEQTLRIIDATLDRTTEGLRVLEDIARFVLDDSSVAQELKELRHAIHQAFPGDSLSLVSARDSQGDVGRRLRHQKEPAINLIDTVIANARRVEQSLRVLEETSRLPDTCFSGSVFEESRYTVYDLEKELVSRLSRGDKGSRLGVYIVIENETQLSKAIENKVSAIQIDPGTLTQRQFYELAESSRNRCAANNILLIAGDQPHIAVAVNADGVALDENSLPISIARRLLKIDRVIGYAAKSSVEALQAESCGADFILCPENIKNAVSLEVKIPVISPIQGDNYD